MKQKFGVATIAAAFLLGVVCTYVGTMVMWGSNSNVNIASSTNNTDFEKIQEIYDLIKARYVEEVDSSELINGAIEGMVATLDDPFSIYMNSTETQQFEESLDSSFSGIGAEVNMIDGKLYIITPIKGAPAEKAGLRANDQIITVNGKSLEGLSQMEAISKIRGEKGSTAVLEVNREGVRDVLTFEVVRDEIPITTVHSEVKEENGKQIGYLQITSFSENTAAEFKTALESLEEQSIEGLVIDVRGNGGGYLESVEEIASLLVTDEKPIVQIEQRDGKINGFTSSLTEARKYPIAVLIDGGTASASEILAGALKEIGNYPIIGVTSYGKGTVQSAIELEDGSSLKLTQYKWLTPKGNWIHEKGIAPTIEVKQPNYFYVSPIQFEDELKFDMNDEQIGKAQIMLAGLGFDPGRQDGYFSEDTERAVKKFQQTKDLTVTGTINEETVEALHTAITEVIADSANDQQLKKALQVVAE